MRKKGLKGFMLKRILALIIFLSVGSSIFPTGMRRLSNISAMKADNTVISFQEWINGNRYGMYEKYGRIK